MKRDRRTIERMKIDLACDLVDVCESLTIVAEHFENVANDRWSQLFSCDDPIHDRDGRD